MSQHLGRRAFVVLLVIGGAVAVVLTRPPRLGLDLRGGTQIVLEAQDTPQREADADAVDRTLEVLRGVDQLGVSEPALQSSGGEILNDFALALIVGILVETYSSMLTAATLAVALEGVAARLPSPGTGPPGPCSIRGTATVRAGREVWGSPEAEQGGEEPMRTGTKRATRSLVLLALLAASCSGPPPTVERITIANPTAYDIDVDVTGPGQEGRLPIAIVEAGSEDVVQEVIDQGEVWIFRFLHWGDPVGELRLTRGELERNGWHVEVPAEVGERLKQLGRPTSEELRGVEPGGGG